MRLLAPALALLLCVLSSLLPVAQAENLCQDWGDQCEQMERDLLRLSYSRATQLTETLSWVLRPRRVDRVPALNIEPKEAFSIHHFGSDGMAYVVKLKNPLALFREIGKNYVRKPLVIHYSTLAAVGKTGFGNSSCTTQARFYSNAGELVYYDGLSRFDLIADPKDAIESYELGENFISIYHSPGYEGKTIKIELACDECEELGVVAQEVTLCTSGGLTQQPPMVPTQQVTDAPLKERETPPASNSRLKLQLGLGVSPNSLQSIPYSSDSSIPSLILAIELENHERFYLRAEAQLSWTNSGYPDAPYVDIRFTPYLFQKKNVRESSIALTTLSGNLSRNIYTSRDFQARVSAFAFEGRAMYSGSSVELFFEVAARALGFNLDFWRNNAPAAGLAVAEGTAKTGVAFNPRGSFVVRVFLGGNAQLNASFKSGIDTELRAYSQVSAEFAKFFEVFLRASLEAVQAPSLQLPTNFRLVAGVGLIF